MKFPLPLWLTAALLAVSAHAAHLRLEPALQTLPPGGTARVDVWVDTPDTPLGAVALELPLGPPGLVTLAGVDAVQSSSSGGFTLTHHLDVPTRTLRLLATSGRDPSRWRGSFRVCSLRLWLDPSAPHLAMAPLNPTNVILLASVATPDDPGLPARPLSVTQAGATIVLDDIPVAGLSLHPADPHWIPGRITPVTLRFTAGALPPGLLLGRLASDPSRLRILGMEPLRRDFTFLGNSSDRAAGSLPFVLVHRGSGVLPAGPVDVATVWVEPRVPGTQTLRVTDLARLDGDATAPVGVPLDEVVLNQSSQADPGLEPQWEPPPPDGVVSGQVMRVTLRAPAPVPGEGNCLAAGLEWDPARWDFLGVAASSGTVRPGVITNASALASGRVRFLVSHALLPGTAAGLQPVAEVLFLPRGTWLSEATLAGRVDAASTGIGPGAGIPGFSEPALAPLHLVVFGPPGDTNANTLPDWWESHFGVSDPGGDPDGDGFSNLQEWIALTDPVRRASRFGLASASVLPPSMAIPPGAQLLRWGSARGRRYRILSTADLRQPFTVLVDGILATPPVNEFAVPAGAQGFLTIQLVD